MSSENPLVSICCLAFNHGEYIREALDSFLMQVTDFNVEILVHDDASTDDTANIIREYEAKHPDLIKPIYQTENQFSQGVIAISSIYNFSRAKGKYIAICEGDDYWTDRHKLQKQVDVLENNSNYAASCHRVKVIVENSHEEWLSPLKLDKDAVYGESDVFLQNVAPTCSFVFRSHILRDPKRIKYRTAGDWLLQLYATQGGAEIYCFSEVMGVYRRHKKGVWTGASPIKKLEQVIEIREHIFPRINSKLLNHPKYQIIVNQDKLRLIYYNLKFGTIGGFICSLIKNWTSLIYLFNYKGARKNRI